MIQTKRNIKDIRVRSNAENKKTEKTKENKKCIWPGCEENQFITVSLPVAIDTPQGIKPKDPPQSISAPFCNYHFAIASSGVCASIETSPGKFGFMAPIDMVKVSEAVISGMIFSGQLSKLLKAKENSLNQGGETNEHKPDNEKKEGDKPSDNDRDKQRSESEQGKGRDTQP